MRRFPRAFCASTPFYRLGSPRQVSAARSFFAQAGAASKKSEFDLVILGGGSGGLAMSREASRMGKSVAVLDFVTPSPAGSKWGLGGTCVNVGCIPKKLMHQAGLLGVSMRDAVSYGWKEHPREHDWSKMVKGITGYIKSLNFGYRVRLNDDGVTYMNALGSFVDANTLEASFANGRKEVISAKYVAVAVGGRPRYPNIPGGEHVISSDDIFSLKRAPGKTLVVGASYVALECAGFLTELGYDTTVLARSVFLRGFDQDMSNKVVSYMKDHGTKFVQGHVLHSVEKQASGRLLVTLVPATSPAGSTDGVIKEEYDTVFAAIGREPNTAALNLQRVGVEVDPVSRKIITDANEQTSAPNIYALGDVAQGRPELTPSAILAGKLLARRIFDRKRPTPPMDYSKVPTTVFTPLEYSCVGLTEEEAAGALGDKMEVYHAHFQPLEWSLPSREENACYVKMIVDGTHPEAHRQTVLGLHYLGPNAGEVMQGFAAALRCGATREDLEHTVGIHPTDRKSVV